MDAGIFCRSSKVKRICAIEMCAREILKKKKLQTRIDTNFPKHETLSVLLSSVIAVFCCIFVRHTIDLLVRLKVQHNVAILHLMNLHNILIELQISLTSKILLTYIRFVLSLCILFNYNFNRCNTVHLLHYKFCWTSSSPIFVLPFVLCISLITLLSKVTIIQSFLPTNFISIINELMFVNYWLHCIFVHMYTVSILFYQIFVYNDCKQVLKFIACAKWNEQVYKNWCIFRKVLLSSK